MNEQTQKQLAAAKARTVNLSDEKLSELYKAQRAALLNGRGELSDPDANLHYTAFLKKLIQHRLEEKAKGNNSVDQDVVKRVAQAAGIDLAAAERYVRANGNPFESQGVRKQLEEYDSGETDHTTSEDSFAGLSRSRHVNYDD